MQTLLKISPCVLLAALAAAGFGVAAAADPFGRVHGGVAVDPPPQVFVNPYAAPPPAKLPGMRLAALGQVVRVGRLDDAYRATAPGELPASQVGPHSTVAPQTLPPHPTAQPLVPTASANAPATITRDRAVVPAAYGTGVPYGAGTRAVAEESLNSGANPLRRAEPPADRSSNPLR